MDFVIENVSRWFPLVYAKENVCSLALICTGENKKLVLHHLPSPLTLKINGHSEHLYANNYYDEECNLYREKSFIKGSCEGDAAYLEGLGREVFEVYKNSYYTDGVLSVYMEEGDKDGDIKGLILIKNTYTEKDSKYAWDSTNRVYIEKMGEGEFLYTVDTRVIVFMGDSKGIALGMYGSVGKISKERAKISNVSDHLSIIGKLLEGNENYLRCQLGNLHLRRTCHVLQEMMKDTTGRDTEKMDSLLSELSEKLKPV